MNLKKTAQDIKKFTTPLGRLVQSCVRSICFLCGCQHMQLQKSGEYLARGEALKKTCNPKSPKMWLPPPGSVGIWGKALPDLSRRACGDEASSGALREL